MNVGIFWLLPHPKTGIALVSCQTPLDQAEEYGDCVTCPLAHIDAWEAVKRGKPLLSPLDQEIRAAISVVEYEYWPRGRIVFDRSAGRFVAYVDPQTIPYASLIRGRFTLPETTIFRCDQHYKTQNRRLKLNTQNER